MNQLRINIEKETERAAKNLGYTPDIFAPQTYNEKILWKKFFDRDPLLTETSDKIKVKKYIAEKAGKQYVIPTLFYTNRPETIPFEKLPANYVIKPNHASGQYLFIHNGDADKKKIMETCTRWLSKPFGQDRFEWAYRDIERNILIEPLLQDVRGQVPQDFKFYMTEGRCIFIHLDDDRFTAHSRVCYTPDWRPMTGVKVHCKRLGTAVSQPPELYSMLIVASALSARFLSCRVDMYLVNGKIYVGEITHYPGSGHSPIEPREIDYWIGNQINIANYAR